MIQKVYIAKPVSFWKHEYIVFEQVNVSLMEIGIIKHFYLKDDYFYLKGKETERYYLKGYRSYSMETPDGEVISTEKKSYWWTELSFRYKNISYTLKKKAFKNLFQIYQFDREIGALLKPFLRKERKLSLTTDIPKEIVMFMFYICIMLKLQPDLDWVRERRNS